MQDTVKTDAESAIPVANVEQPEKSAPLPSFEIFRFRQTKGTGDMYDPALDMMKVLPVCVNSTMEVLDGLLNEGDEELYREACNMAHDIYTLFEIRLQEEHCPINEVLRKFIDVLHKYPERLVHMFEEVLFVNLMTMYGVASRRLDGEVTPIIKDLEDDVVLSTIMSLVDKPTAAAMRKDLSRVYFDNIKRIDTPEAKHTINIVDSNGELILDNAKSTVARHFRVKDGEQDWDTIASIVDRATENDNDVTSEAYRKVYEKYNK